MRDTSWWKRGVIYQIYPKSFCDGNGDGIGDLPGILSKLDYIKRLGANIIWLNPIYPSPDCDDGYDISDYLNVRPEFGTLDDFAHLVAGAHARGLRIVLDLVVNHTSSEHPWFKAACASRDCPQHDYYIWRDPAPDGGAPNNWAGVFGGPAWEYVESVGQYYLHDFTPQQPDLNWDNPEVRRLVAQIVATWRQRGVDGFRMDVIDMVSKEPGLPDVPAAPGELADCLPAIVNGPHVHEYLRELNARAFAGTQMVAIGECPGATAETAPSYVGASRGELDMLFQFEHVNLDHDPTCGKWCDRRMPLPQLKACFARWQAALHGVGWNALYLCNHDQPRIVSRMGDGTGPLRMRSATCLATALHLMQGTPCVYQGEELGMANFPFTSPKQLRDVESINAYRSFIADGATPSEAMARVAPKCRDNARMPMQWTAGANAGFTQGSPWMPINPDHATVNVASQEQREDSTLAYYRRLIALRRKSPYADIIAEGCFQLLAPDDEGVFAYRREADGEILLVACNISPAASRLEVPPDLRGIPASPVIRNMPGNTSLPLAATLELEPYEALALLFPARRN